MKKLSPSIKIYIGLIVTLTILAALGVFSPQGGCPTIQNREKNKD